MGLLAQLESDRQACLLLSNRCALRRVSAGSNILDPDGDDVAAAELTPTKTNRPLTYDNRPPSPLARPQQHHRPALVVWLTAATDGSNFCCGVARSHFAFSRVVPRLASTLARRGGAPRRFRLCHHWSPFVRATSHRSTTVAFNGAIQVMHSDPSIRVSAS